MQKRLTMKKFLEVLIDDAGEMHLSSDCHFVKTTELAKRSEVSNLLDKAAIKSLIKELWAKKDPEVSFAIRVMSTAEMLANPDPYGQAEEFWFYMMHDFIPMMEKYAERLKVEYGFDPSSVKKPVIFFNPEFFGPSRTIN